MLLSSKYIHKQGKCVTKALKLLLCYRKSSVMIHLEIPRRSADSSREHYCRLTPYLVCHISIDYLVQCDVQKQNVYSYDILSLFMLNFLATFCETLVTIHWGWNQSWNVLMNYLSFISFFMIKTKYLPVICKRINTHGFSILQGIFNMCYNVLFLKQVLFL